MKKLIAMVMVIAMLAVGLVGCKEKTDYTVGVCQLMKHDALDAATQGFCDALNKKMTAAGKTVNIDVQVAVETANCTTIINTFTSKNVDLIMGNATPALLAAANATVDIPVLGTSVTDYQDTFGGNIPANVSGTSDAVPFDEQAKMMIETLNLQSGDLVGVLYCTNESNSKVQYEAVKTEFEKSGIQVKAYTFSDTTDLNTVVNSMVGNVDAIYVPSDNTVAANESAVKPICDENKIPVYASYGGEMSYASLAIDYYQLGYETGLMAAQILLEGKSPADIQVMTLTPTKTYNEELCKLLEITVPAE